MCVWLLRALVKHSWLPKNKGFFSTSGFSPFLPSEAFLPSLLPPVGDHTVVNVS